jgi:hypothetical protein
MPVTPGSPIGRVCMEETKSSEKAIEAVKRDQTDGKNFWDH